MRPVLGVTLKGIEAVPIEIVSEIDMNGMRKTLDQLFPVRIECRNLDIEMVGIGIRFENNGMIQVKQVSGPTRCGNIGIGEFEVYL